MRFAQRYAEGHDLGFSGNQGDEKADEQGEQNQGQQEQGQQEQGQQEEV